MTPKLSIIIPVYNTEIYLKECLDSLVNQTFKDIEIIIVNDCSPDNSEAVVLEYQQKDPRIKYIKHDINKSVFQARISGVHIASGDYIWCVDSDDYLYTLDALQILSNTIDSTQAEVIQFDIQCLDPNLKNWFTPLTTKLLSSSNEISSLFFNNYMKNVNLANRIIKKEIFIDTLKNISPDLYINMAEDFLQCSLIMNLANSYVGIKDKLYFYRENPSSTTNVPLTSEQLSNYTKDYNTVLHILSKNLSPKHIAYAQYNIHTSHLLPRIQTLLNQTPPSIDSVLSIKKELSLFDFTHEDFQQYPTLLYINTIDQINDDSIVLLSQLQKYHNIQYDKWYLFGQLTKKQKIKKLIVTLFKKLKIYNLLKHISNIISK